MRVLLIVAVLVSLVPLEGLAFDGSAQARVGRPLTPGSVAGVNRRVHRRAAYGAAAVGAAAVGAYGYNRWHGGYGGYGYGYRGGCPQY